MSDGVLSALPFSVKSSQDVMTGSAIVSTTETVNGLLILKKDRLVIQWRRARTTSHMGGLESRVDKEFDDVQEIVVPLEKVAGAQVRKTWWGAPRLSLTASDLRAFEALAGESGMRAGHPAELTLGVRRKDRLNAREFAAELSLAIAQHQLDNPDERTALTP